MRETSSRFFDRSKLVTYLLPALVLTMGLQLLRVFFVSLVWYLRDTVGVSALSLAPYAFGTFLIGFFAPALRRLVGPRTALWITAGGVAALRVAEQFVRDPGLDLWLSIGGVALLVLFLPIFLGHLRALGAGLAERWSYGLVIGLALDIALRGVFGSVDLSWTAGPIPIVLIVLLAASVLWALGREPEPEPDATGETTWSRALPLLAIGPYLLLQLLLYQSEGFVEVIASLPDPLGFIIVMVGNLAAAIGVVWGLSRPSSRRPLLALAIGVYLTVAVATINQPGTTIVLTVVIGQVLMGWGWALIGTASQVQDRPGLGRTTAATAGGLIIFLVLVFVYYLALDMALPFPREFVPPAAAALLGAFYLAASRQRRGVGPRKPWELTGVSATAALILVPALYWLISAPAPEPQQPVGLPIRVMSYNIHSAVGMEGRQDPEAIAQVIEDSEADIIALQEVARVRLLDGEADLPVWLSRRLGMPMLFQGTEEPIWGNAILSRFPILESGSGVLPRDGTLIGRGYLWALIDIGETQPLLFIATHLHHVDEESLPRQAQVPVLMDFWAERPLSALLGDLNAEPDSPEMQMIIQAGMLDSWSEAGSGPGYTFSARDPRRRIDWVWHSEDLATIEVQVISSLASDHLPVLAILDQAAP